ncbi:MAG TPA: RDD family protein [Phycisphaerae bacterium]|nr:RDD family protein [Phycisphaerae bacterium]
MTTLLRHLLPAAFLLASAARIATAELESVHAAGGEQSVWLILTDRPGTSSEQPTHRLIYRSVTASHFRRYRGGERITGEIRGAAVLASNLHLFFAGGSHRCYSPTRDEPRLALPSGTPPRLVCADEPASALWATASPTSTTSQAASSPGDQDPAGSNALLRHQLNTWSAIALLPQSAARATQQWMCAADGAVHLFWSPAGRSSLIWHATWREGDWSSPETTQVPVEQVLTVSLVNQQLMAAFAPAPEPTGWRKVLQFAHLTPEGWAQHSVSLSGDGLSDAEFEPSRLFAAPLGQNMLIGTWLPDGTVTAGLAGLNDDSVALTDVTAAQSVEMPPSPVSPTPPWLVAALMAAIMLVLFWRRQSALLRPAALPPELTCAALWRRGLAFVIDALPAAAVTTPLWHALAVKVIATGPPEQVDPATHAALLHAFWTAWAGFRCVHGAYCALGEALMGSSPGKRLLGCRVVTEQGDRISLGQAILRNLFRVLELEIDPPLLPLVLLVGLTRNRQRLGDIVARTVVVEVRRGEPAGVEPRAASQDDPR